MSTAPASAEVRSVRVVDWRHLATSATWTALVLYVLLALLLAFRRLSGATSPPIAGPLLIPLAASIAAASVLVRLWLLPVRLDSLARRNVRDLLVLVIPSLSLAVLLAALMTPGTSRGAALGAWIFAALVELVFWRHIAVALRSVGQASRLSVSERAAGEAEPSPDDSVDESYPVNLLQQIVRTRKGAGEAIHAVLRAEFQPGEQVQVLHVAFCPPLKEAPRLEAFVSGETEADVKVTSAYSFGARLEVQLEQPAVTSQSVVVELHGHADRTG